MFCSHFWFKAKTSIFSRNVTLHCDAGNAQLNIAHASVSRRAKSDVK